MALYVPQARGAVKTEGPDHDDLTEPDTKTPECSKHPGAIVSRQTEIHQLQALAK
jgi:hypothetical protein